jgi:transcriptional antiterminator NusG
MIPVPFPGAPGKRVRYRHLNCINCLRNEYNDYEERKNYDYWRFGPPEYLLSTLREHGVSGSKFCEQQLRYSQKVAQMTDGFNWYALHVRSRYDFVTRDELRRKEIEAYLPSVKRQSQWKDRKKNVEFPLFPGYLFVFVEGSHEAFTAVLKTRGVVNLLSAQPGRPAAVPSEEIDSLKLLVGSGSNFEIYPNLQIGKRVRVIRGPLTGALGTIVNKKEQYMFLVNIDILGRSVGVHVFADDIEPD